MYRTLTMYKCSVSFKPTNVSLTSTISAYKLIQDFAPFLLTGIFTTIYTIFFRIFSLISYTNKFPFDKNIAKYFGISKTYHVVYGFSFTRFLNEITIIMRTYTEIPVAHMLFSISTKFNKGLRSTRSRHSLR